MARIDRMARNQARNRQPRRSFPIQCHAAHTAEKRASARQQAARLLGTENAENRAASR